MNIGELKEIIKDIPNETTVCVFANDEVYDIKATQIFEGEFELGCGWESRL